VRPFTTVLEEDQLLSAVRGQEERRRSLQRDQSYVILLLSVFYKAFEFVLQNVYE